MAFGKVTLNSRRKKEDYRKWKNNLVSTYTHVSLKERVSFKFSFYENVAWIGKLQEQKLVWLDQPHLYLSFQQDIGAKLNLAFSAGFSFSCFAHIIQVRNKIHKGVLFAWNGETSHLMIKTKLLFCIGKSSCLGMMGVSSRKMELQFHKPCLALPGINSKMASQNIWSWKQLT